MVAVGLRCMRRPGEVVALMGKDVRRIEEGVVIRIRSSKTDKFRKGKDIPMDKGHNKLTCPVRLLEDWMEFAKVGQEEFLFPNMNTGGKWSTSGIATAVKGMATQAGMRGKFTGHSLRIGGATAAMKGGMSLAMIKAIGGWESAVVLVYLRAIGAAQAGASRMMGF